MYWWDHRGQGLRDLAHALYHIVVCLKHVTLGHKEFHLAHVFVNQPFDQKVGFLAQSLANGV